MFESSYDGEFNGDMEDLMAILDGSLVFSDEDRRHLVALFDAEIRELDESLATFLNILNMMGHMDNTVLILLSDHGEEFFDHGGVLHSRTLYDELIRIPLVLVGPGIPAGKGIEQQVRLIDVMPTILDICRIKEPRDIAGISLLPLLTGNATDWEQIAFAEADKENEELDIFRAVRTGTHKFYFNRLTGDEYLFDLTLDPTEKIDILEDEPELGEMHREMLKEWMNTKKGNPKKIAFQEHEKELLRSLGYLK